MASALALYMRNVCATLAWSPAAQSSYAVNPNSALVRFKSRANRLISPFSRVFAAAFLLDSAACATVDLPAAVACRR